MAFQYSLNNPRRHFGILGQDDDGGYGSGGWGAGSYGTGYGAGDWGSVSEGESEAAAESEAWSAAMAEAKTAMQTETEEAELGAMIAESLSEAAPETWTLEEQLPPWSPTWTEVVSTMTAAEKQASVNASLKTGGYIAPGDPLYDTALSMWAEQDPVGKGFFSSVWSFMQDVFPFAQPLLSLIGILNPVVGLTVKIGTIGYSLAKAAIKASAQKVAQSTNIPASTIESKMSQNMKIIGAKMDYADAQGRGDVIGTFTAHAKAEQARAAGGLISSSTPLDQNLIDAYNMWSRAQSQAQLASFASGKIFGIPTWIIFAGLGVGLIFGGRVRKRR